VTLFTIDFSKDFRQLNCLPSAVLISHTIAGRMLWTDKYLLPGCKPVRISSAKAKPEPNTGYIILGKFYKYLFYGL
jgi:hypothetical protein